MTATYEKIATLSPSASATVDFNSIPATYTDLVLIGNFSAANSGNTLFFKVNSSSTGYSATTLYGTGSTAGSGRLTNQSYGLLFDTTIGVSTSLQNVVISNFMNYSNTTTYKTVLSRGNNAGGITEADVTLWQNTAAISSISIFMGGVANTVTGTFTLYGIKAE
jgi:hypothetical protein